MSLDPVTVVIASGFIVVALTALFLMLALRYDRIVSAAGPRITRDELEAQIEIKRQALADIDKQIQDRTEAMENTAALQAEFDALCRQRDEILARLATLSDRKEEIREMDRETEEAVARFAEARRDLDEKEESLRKVQAQLDRAEALVGEIGNLQDEADLLRTKIDELQTKLGDLRQLKEDEVNLRKSVENLRREVSHLEGATNAASERLLGVKSDLKAAEGKRAEVQASLDEILTQNAVAALEVRQLEADRSMLEARVAQLRADASELAGTEKSPTEDPLRELKSVPLVLRQLKELNLRDRETEEEALHRVQTHMQDCGLKYPRRTIRGFHTAMKVNETSQLAVLAGISGTGKSQLPRRYSEGMGIGFLQVPVQPRWDSPQDLLGFYNYIEGRFRPTDLARALYQCDAYNCEDKDPDLQDRVLMVLLDEMNLARVEYYFSDFLSRLESRPERNRTDDETARKDAEIELEIRMEAGKSLPRIFPGYNVLFAGTMNEDESTQSLSDKVVDRANVFRFAAPRKIHVEAPVGDAPERKALSRERWNGWVRESAYLGAEGARVTDLLEDLVDIMRELQRPIGHRLGSAMMSYVANYPETGGRSRVDVPLADQVEMRLLPKLRGIEMDHAGSHLDKLERFVESTLSDAELANAIRESGELSRVESGQFVWRGVTRE